MLGSAATPNVEDGRDPTFCLVTPAEAGAHGSMGPGSPGTAAKTHSAATARPGGLGGSRRTGGKTGQQAEGRPAGGRKTGQDRNSTRRDEAAREAAADGGNDAAATAAGETRCAKAR